MKSLLLVVALGLFAFGCTTPEADYPTDNPVVHLVSEDALRSVFPAAVDSFQAVSDTTYRGYGENEAGPFSQITVARTYGTPAGNYIAINLSSFEGRDQFMAAYGNGAVRDSTAEMETYDVTLGRLVLVDDAHAAEAKGFEPAALIAALDLIDYEALTSLTTEPIEVDSTWAVR